ncbi:MAG: alkaline ceramidase, partial [Faecalispora jeddahensis]
MQLGTAKLTITPPMPVRLCGYATRTTLFEQVKEDIFVRVQLHRCGQEQLLFVYGDLLWWGWDFVAQTREKISAACKIAQEQIF